jgi:prepilin-type N-terminal cleavage/methylation domain-containing protein
MRIPPNILAKGFSLLELSVVLAIMALLLGGLLTPLAAQRDVAAASETQLRLAEIRDALLGFAIANERLPCPASDSSNGRESFCSSASGTCVPTTVEDTPAVLAHGRCSNWYDGFVPAVSLGLAPLDAQGYLLDGWANGSASRIRYAVSSSNNSFAYTQSSGMKLKGIAALQPDLKVCNAGDAVLHAGDAGAATCATNTALVSDAVVIVYSLGRSGGSGGTGADERHNPNVTPGSSPGYVPPDPAFVNAAPGPDFDDEMIWLSKHILYNRMVSAAKLP